MIRWLVRDGQAAREADDALGVLGEQLEIHARLAAVQALEEALARERREVLEALVGRRQQRQVVALDLAVAHVAVVDEVGLEAEQRLDAVLLGRLVELDGAVHDAVVGQADGRLAVGGGALGELVDVARAVEQRVLGVDVQVRDGRGAHGVETIGVAADATRARAHSAAAMCGDQNDRDVRSTTRSACAAWSTRAGSTPTSAGRSSARRRGRPRRRRTRRGRRWTSCSTRPGARIASAVRRRGGAGRPGRVGGDRAGGRRVHRARGRRGDGGAAAHRRGRADAARARVQVRALRRAGGRAGARGSTTSPRRSAPGPAAILHPAHLDGAAGTLAAEQLAPLARAAGVPVVVDAAYQSFPLSELARWSTAGDVACFSAKYFWGPNAGGFVAGRAGLVADVAALDFTGYESGPWRTFGRAFKLDRATVVATVAALEAWMVLDHDARWRGYAALADALAERLCGAPRGAGRAQAVHARRGAGRTGRSTPCSSAAARPRSRPRSPRATRACARWPTTTRLVFCTEALASGELDEIVAALANAWQRLAEG